MFFILYINDLLSILSNGTILSYLDDVTVMSNKRTWIDTQNILTEFLKRVNAWLSLTQISSKTNKSVFINFSSTDKNLPANIKININVNLLKRED